MYRTVLKLEGMMCGMCEAHINDVIRKTIKDVKELKTSHSKGTSSFLSDEKPDEDVLRKAIESTGYQLKDYHSEIYEKKRFSLFG